MKAHFAGDNALLFDLEIGDLPDRAARTLATAAALRGLLPAADVVVGAGSVMVVGVSGWADPQGLVRRAAEVAARPAAFAAARRAARIDVVYDGADLPGIAAALGVSVEAVIELHTGPEYTVEMLGFMPGFAYMGPVSPRLALPRRSAPRPAVPAGSVAIAAGFTGVYRRRSPGGWHLLGRAPRLPPLHVAEGLLPGDAVRFFAIPPEEPAHERPAGQARATRALVVEAAPACATIQDAGRSGMLGEGFPPSGPLDPTAFAAANLAVGNEARAAAVEVPLGALAVRAVGAVEVSVDGEPPVMLRDGEAFRVEPCERAVRYLAVRGGVDCPVVKGSRATLVSAGLGGLEGRPLKRGDQIAVGGDSGSAVVRRPAPEVAGGPVVLRVEPGPHVGRLGEEALGRLFSEVFRVSRLGDRVGVRLEGSGLPVRGGRLELPIPMLRGAIEVTPEGQPIVLGPDHPTTGGYPVVAWVTRASQSVLARLRPGEEVRFSAVI